jgi:fibronectin-binding autotransporter adhesin
MTAFSVQNKNRPSLRARHAAARLRFGMKARAAALALGAAVLLLAGRPTQAAMTDTWTTAAGGDWDTLGNWTGEVPGTADTALFNIAMTGNVTLASASVMNSINFDTNASTFTVGTVGGNTLTGSNGGAISVLPTLAGMNETFTINAPLILTPASSTTAGAYTIQNNATSATNTLVIGGGISSGTTSNTETLTLGGSNTGANTISGNITNGNATTFAVTKTGAGTWTLSGTGNSYNGATTISAGTLSLTGSLTGGTAITNSGTFTESGTGVIGGAATLTNNAGTTTLSGINTYTGATSVNGGTLNLDFSAATTPSTATNIIKSTTTINLGGGALVIKGGGSGDTNSQTFGTTALTANTSSTITVNSNSGTVLNLAFGGITRNVQSTLDLTPSAAGTVTTTSTTFASNGILVSAATNGVAFATANTGATWLANSAGTLSAFTAYTPGAATPANYVAANNVDVTSGDSVSGITVNTLRFNSSADALTLAGTNVISTGGILITGSGAGSTISGGTIQGGGGEELAFLDYSSANISSTIVNASSGASALTLAGTGTTTLSGANTYTGTTAIDGGTVLVGVAQSGTTSGPLGTGVGALSMGSGSTLNLEGDAVTVGTMTANSTGTNATVTSTSAATLTLAGGSNLSTLTVNGAASLLVNGGSSLTTANATLIAGTGSLGFQNQTGQVRDNNLQANLGSNGSLLFNGTGQFQTTSAQTLGTGNGVIVNNTGNVWNFQGTTVTNGAWTGSGTININQGNAPMFTFGGNMTGFTGTLQLAVGGTTSNNSDTFALSDSTSNNVGGASAVWDQQVLSAGNTGTNTLEWNGTGSQTIPLGDLNTTGTVAGSGTIRLLNATASTTATFQVGALNLNSTYAGNIIANGTAITAITKVGAGTWTLTGANTYTGATTVSAGTLALSGSGTLGSGAALTLGGGTLDLGGLTETVGAVSISAAAASANTIENGSLIGTSYAASNTTGTAAVTANLLANGTAGLTKTGAGTLTLSGANTYTGSTSINGGVLSISAANNLGNNTQATNTLSFNGGTLDSTAGTYDLGVNRAITLNGAGTIQTDSGTLTVDGSITGAQLLTVTGAGNTTISGVIGNGSGGLTYSGSGTLTLSGANTYTGQTSISSGTVLVGVAQNGTSSGALGTGVGALVMGSGTTLNLEGDAVTVGTLTANSTGTNATVTSTAPATLTINGGNISRLTVGGEASLMVAGGSGGTNQLTTANAVLLTNTTSTAGSIGFENQTGTNGGGIRDNYIGVQLGSNGTLLFNGYGALQTGAGSGAPTATLGANNPVVVNGTTVNYWNFQNTVTTSGAWTGSGTIDINQGSTPTFNFAGNMTGFGGTLELSTGGAANNATFELTNSTTIGGAGAVWNQQLEATGTSGTNTLEWAGTGSHTIPLGDLNTTGTYSGPGIQLLNATVSTTATFQVGALNLNSTYAGNIVNGSGTTAISKVGTGAWTLTGANTYTGATTVSAGTLVLGATNTLTATSGITVGTGATLSLTANNALATPSAITTVGSGGPGTTSTTQVSVTLSGGTLLRNGTLVTTGLGLGSGMTVGAGALTLTANSTINYGTTGVGTLNFDGFVSTSGKTLSVINYTNSEGPDTSGKDGTDDRLIFNQNLSMAQLGDITIDGLPSSQTAELALGNGEYEIVAPVPEPATWAAGLLSLGALGFHLRRRRKRAA